MLIPIEPRDAIEQVALDVASALGPLLETHGEGSIEPGGPFAAGLPSPFADIPIAPLTNEDNTVHVVPWEWSGDDTAQGISELGPSYRPVIIRGVTIVTRFDDPDDFEGWRLFRFVDWMDAFNQAGISVATRPIRDLRTSQNIDETDLRAEYPALDAAYTAIESQPPVDPKSEWVHRMVPTMLVDDAEMTASRWFGARTARRAKPKAKRAAARKKAAAKTAAAKTATKRTATAKKTATAQKTPAAKKKPTAKRGAAKKRR